ncbi:tripartite tricarboxylate transporter substrate binding protein [Chelativorans sp. AA-79]|uniref:Bug family tripartite tricarboxylate transporter substrate binding protein n=1 Tax=Chelativorans sp. AA-79 TaxID=3028735 RepID=UPI0023F69386|nr:tripartite tricarboxylate transporter substrate binding protein [Chelativorans sp. AA-79]WEX12161.1 tripartite tricarboxylate transporter substrate binding protein [Chelativorans sp. AA-79]
MFKSLKSALVVGMMAIVAGSAPALAQDYPSQPLRIIAPTNPGGSVDMLARVVQEAIEEMALYPSVVVVNQPLGGGTIGTRNIKDAKPDGYTIGIWHPGFVTSKAMGVVDFDHNDFTILGGTNRTNISLAVRSDSRFETPQDLIDEAKAAPNSIVIASNIGLPVHFFPLMFAQEAGIELKFIQSGGGGARLAAVLGGHADAAQLGGPELLAHADSGIRPLVMFSEERDPAFPDTPTAKEIGVDFSADIFLIFVAPKGLGPEIETKLRETLQTALASDAVQTRLRDLNADPTWIAPEEVDERLDEITRRIEPLTEKVRAQKDE